MPVRLVIAALAISGLSAEGFAGPLADRLLACRALKPPDARLRCYDALVPSTDLAIDGKGSAVTDLFTVSAPRLLRFESADAIMVVYLLDEAGKVVQNLHRGGAGEGQHLIELPGTYRVQVNATGGWSLRLEVP